jgi:hypothetical protein
MPQRFNPAATRRTSMLVQILSHTPTYVFAILAGLMALGLMQTRTRSVALPKVALMPLALMGLGLWSLAPTFTTQPVVAGAWLMALGIGAWGGSHTPQAPGTRWQAERGHFVVPGSWIPMGFIVFIFLLRYAAGVGNALHPEWRTDLTVQLPLATVFGCISGLSVGRVLGLVRLMKPATVTTIGSHA